MHVSHGWGTQDELSALPSNGSENTNMLDLLGRSLILEAPQRISYSAPAYSLVSGLLLPGPIDLVNYDDIRNGLNSL